MTELGLTASALAHPRGDSSLPDFLWSWSWDPLALFGLIVLFVAYALGVGRLWRRAGVGHGVRRWQAACFAAATSVLVLALISPIDTASDWLFSVHMLQHELLLLIAAPLWAMSAPLAAMSWALPERGRRRLRESFHRPLAVASWRLISQPTLVVVLHVAVLWLWHAPVMFEAALRSEAVHAVQHLMFFSTAVLFWWALVHGRYGRLGYGVGVAFVFATATQGGILGALITLADRLWYPEYAARVRAIGRVPLEDQQLAGLLMWVPAGVISTCLGLALFAAWLGEAERRARRWEITSGFAPLQDGDPR